VLNGLHRANKTADEKQDVNHSYEPLK